MCIRGPSSGVPSLLSNLNFHFSLSCPSHSHITTCWLLNMPRGFKCPWRALLFHLWSCCFKSWLCSHLSFPHLPKWWSYQCAPSAHLSVPLWSSTLSPNHSGRCLTCPQALRAGPLDSPGLGTKWTLKSFWTFFFPNDVHGLRTLHWRYLSTALKWSTIYWKAQDRWLTC